MAKIRLIKRQGGVLVASLQCDADLLQKWRVGEILEADVKRPRNGPFHRKFFAMLDVVFENQSEYEQKEPMRKAIIMQCGYFEEVRALSGKVTYQARSINWADMDDIEFADLYDKAIDVSISYLMKGADANEIKRKVEQLLAFT